MNLDLFAGQEAIKSSFGQGPILFGVRFAK